MKIDWMCRPIVLLMSLAAVLFSVLPVAVLAQESSVGSIAGTVTDAAGRAVVRASVTLKSDASKATQHSSTDDQGHFTFTNLAAGNYELLISAAGFRDTKQSSLQLGAGQSQTVSVQLKVGSLEENVEVQAIAGDSIAGQHALSQGSLDTQTAKSEIGSQYIREFTPPTTDYSEIIQIAPGTFSYNPNGIGLGQGTVYFRGFPDGDYDITWDGIPFDDTNTPTHHSWAFFPGVWVGSVDFDRSPGTASTDRSSDRTDRRRLRLRERTSSDDAQTPGAACRDHAPPGTDGLCARAITGPNRESVPDDRHAVHRSR